MTPKQLTAFALGPIATAALSFISIPIMTWFFSVEDVGRISMLQIAINFSILLLGLGLDQALVREYFECADKPNLLLNTTLPGLILIGIIFVLFILNTEVISILLFDISSSLFSAAVLLCILLSFLSRNLSLLLRLEDNGIAYSLSQFLPKLFFLLMMLFIVFFSDNYIFYQLLILQTVAITFVCILLVWNTRSIWLLAITKRPNFQQIKTMLTYSIPLILGSLAYWGLTALDRIFLRSFSTLAELGVYSLAINFAAAAAILQSVFGILWTPWVYKKEANGNLKIEVIDQVKRYALLVVVVIFCLMGLFSWLIDWVLPQEYEKVKYYVVACLSLPLLYIFSEVTGVGIGITKRTGFYVLASVVALLLNLYLNWEYIPIYGAAGAAASTSLSLFVYFIIRTESSALVWKAMPRLKSYIFMTLSVLLGIIMALQLLADIYLYMSWFTLLLLVLFFHRSDLIQIKNFMYQNFLKR